MSGQSSNRISIKLSSAKKEDGQSSKEISKENQVKSRSKIVELHPPNKQIETKQIEETENKVESKVQSEEPKADWHDAMQRLREVEEEWVSHQSKEAFFAELDKHEQYSTYEMPNDTRKEFSQLDYQEISMLDDSEDKAWWERLFADQNKLHKRPLLRFLFTTIGAVSLGLLFGYMVLQVFLEDKNVQPTTSSLPVISPTVTVDSGNQTEAPPTQPSTGNDQNTQTMGKPSTQASTGNAGAVQSIVQFPEMKFYMVQLGVFTNPEAAQPAIDMLNEDSLPHFLYQMEGKHHLLVALAPSRDAILGFADSVKQKQMDAYVKEILLPASQKQMELVPGSALEIGNSTDKGAVATFFKTGAELTQALASESGKVVNTDKQKITPLTAEVESKLKSKHVQFLDQSRVALQSLPKEYHPYVNGMIDGMNQAITSMTQMKTVNAEPYAWQVQKGLMRYLDQYAKLLQK
ncbi:sporulation protein [Brevibacillus daliensis]|uniref:sporulation protein n=1 Tax=Brevibacillus daliensis TaxID=2892995 RepID=UPI001E4444C6|nr:sporulation protein [Brevibacillus daliensis]